METPEELGIVHASMLRDADWAEINKLSRAFKNGGERALKKAYRELAEQLRTIPIPFQKRIRIVLSEPKN